MDMIEASVAAAGTSPQRIAYAIVERLEEGRLVPGQRLAETDLASQFGVGRNAIREAMQILAARGLLALTPNRSPTIRLLDPGEVADVLDVAQALSGLVAAAAAARFDAAHHGAACATVEAQLEAAVDADEPGQFTRARRRFYRTLLEIGGNRELQRLFPAVSMDLVYIQHRPHSMRRMRLRDYLATLHAVRSGDRDGAMRAAAEHVDHVRQAIRDQASR